MISVLRYPGAAYLVGTSLVGRLPSAMSYVALVRLVRDQGGSYGLASLLTACYVVAGTVGQPALGRAIDRTGRPRLVLGAAASTATVCLVALTWTAVSLPALGVLLSLLAGLATPPLESVLRTLWVRMFHSGQKLHEAFSLDAAAQEILYIAGPLLTAISISLFGVQGNLLFIAAIGLIGAGAFASHPRLAGFEPERHEGGGGTPMAQRGFRRLVLALVCAGLPIGVVIITSAAFGDENGLPNLGAWGLAVNACGSLTGAVLIARFPLSAPPVSRPPHRTIRWVIASLAVLYLPTALSTAPWGLWLSFTYLGGLALPPLLTQVFAECARQVPAAQLNEANAWVVSAVTVGVSGGTLGAGLVIEAASGIPPGITLAVLASSAVALVGALLASPSVLEGERPSDTDGPRGRAQDSAA